MRSDKWKKRFLDLASHIAEWSKDPSTKVGAVIVDDKRRIVATGYNGFPKGVRDSEERLNNRALKHKLVVHAEANAILNAVGSLEGTVLYCTHLPCSSCAKLIIQAGIQAVRVPLGSKPIPGWEDDHELSTVMFYEAHVVLGNLI